MIFRNCAVQRRSNHEHAVIHMHPDGFRLITFALLFSL